MTLIELKELQAKKQSELRGLMQSFGKKKMPDGSEAFDIPADRIGEIRSRNDELSELGSRAFAIESAQRTVLSREDALTSIAASQDAKSIYSQASQFGSPLTAIKQRGGIEIDLLNSPEFKSVITTSTGYAPEVVREGTAVAAISRPPQLIDYLRIVPTSQNASIYMKQNLRTNNIKTKAENQPGEEAAWGYTEVTSPIQDIKGWITVSERQLDDEPMVQAMLKEDLMLMAKQTLDDQVTVGNGTSPNLLGLYNAASAQSQAKGADPTFDTIMKAMTKLRVTGRSVPNLVVMHSNDYQELALSRTSDGIYILGSSANSPMKQIWGVPIALSDALTEGNAMVLDTNFMRVRLRQNALVEMSNAHGDQFVFNNWTLRVTMRAGLEIWRDEAICKVTGI